MLFGNEHREKRLYFLLWKKNIEKSHIFILNLIILLGKFCIHKYKWSQRKPNITHFKTDMKIYFETLQGLSSCKAH